MRKKNMCKFDFWKEKKYIFLYFAFRILFWQEKLILWLEWKWKYVIMKLLYQVTYFSTLKKMITRIFLHYVHYLKKMFINITYTWNLAATVGVLGFIVINCPLALCIVRVVSLRLCKSRNILDINLSLELMSKAITSYLRVSLFLSKNPSTLYQTCPA